MGVNNVFGISKAHIAPGYTYATTNEFSVQGGLGITTNKAGTQPPTTVYYRVGDRLIGSCFFASGTTAGSGVYLQLPAGLTVNNRLANNSSVYLYGTWICLNTSGSGVAHYADQYAGVLYCDGSDLGKLWFSAESRNSGPDKTLGTSIGSGTSGELVQLNFDIPIQQWVE